MSFRVPSQLLILETEYWTLNQRVDAALPGYLMLGACEQTNDLSSMCTKALSELGILLASAQSALTDILDPEHFYIGRYGHTSGHSLHFHLIPVCGWVKQSFLSDHRYRALQDFYYSPASSSMHDADGAEMTLYIWREFCEKPVPPTIYGPSINEIVEQLRGLMSMHKPCKPY